MLYWTLANDPGPEFYYSDIWRQTVEDHLDLLVTANNPTVIDVQPNDAYRYRGDLFGYLTHAGIGLEHHYLVARLNGYRDGSEFDENRTAIVVPSLETIERLRLIAQTTYGQ